MFKYTAESVCVCICVRVCVTAAGPQRAVTNPGSNKATLTQFQAETLRHSLSFKPLPLLCTCIMLGHFFLAVGVLVDIQ